MEGGGTIIGRDMDDITEKERGRGEMLTKRRRESV